MLRRRLPSKNEKRTAYENGDTSLTSCTACGQVVRRKFFDKHKCPKHIRIMLGTTEDPSCPALPDDHVPRKCAKCPLVLMSETRHLFYRKAICTITALGYQKGEYAFMGTCTRCDSYRVNRTPIQRQRYAEQFKETYMETRRGFLSSLFNGMKFRSREREFPEVEFASLNAFVEWCQPHTNCQMCGVELVFCRTDPESLNRQASPDRNVNEPEANLIRTKGNTSFQCYYRPGDFVMNCKFCQFARNRSSVREMQDWISTILFGQRPPDHTFNTYWASRAIGKGTSGKETNQGNRLMEAFDSAWVREVFQRQGGLSPEHLGQIELHQCTEAHCLFRISVDRVNNTDKEHRRDNCALTTLAENLSKSSMRKDIPMTNRRWQQCVIARIENLLVFLKLSELPPGVSPFITEQLNQNGTEDRLIERLRIMRENLAGDDQTTESRG